MTTPNNVLQTSPINQKPTVSVPLLALGGIIFMCTFFYWFTGEQNGLALISKPLLKTISDPSIHFLLNLAAAALGLYLVIVSKAGDWVSWTISNGEELVLSFDRDPRGMTKKISKYKATAITILGILVLWSLLNFSSGEGLTSAKFPVLLSMILLTATLIFWNVHRVEGQLLKPGFPQSTNDILWVRPDIGHKQVLYVEQRRDQLWKLNKDSLVELSYKRAFVYNTLQTMKLTEENLSDNTAGVIKFNFSLFDPKISDFPDELTTDQINQLNTTFSQINYLTSFVRSAIKAEAVKVNALLNETLKKIDKFYNLSNHQLLHDDPKLLQEDLNDIVNKRQEFSNYNERFNQIIESEMKVYFSERHLFKSKFELKEIGGYEEKYTKARQHLTDKLNEMLKNSTENERLILQSKLRILENPSIDPGTRFSHMNVNDKETGAFQKSTATTIGKSPEFKYIEPAEEDIKIASRNIAAAIKQSAEANLSFDEITENVSKSTPYFKQNKIPPMNFVTQFKIKYDDEREERSEEALLKLIEDTLRDSRGEGT